MEWGVKENQNGSNELTHYGIKGMKWGITRTPEQLGHKKTRTNFNMGGKKGSIKLEDKPRSFGGGAAIARILGLNEEEAEELLEEGLKKAELKEIAMNDLKKNGPSDTLKKAANSASGSGGGKALSGAGSAASAGVNKAEVPVALLAGAKAAKKSLNAGASKTIQEGKKVVDSIINRLFPNRKKG